MGEQVTLNEMSIYIMGEEVTLNEMSIYIMGEQVTLSEMCLPKKEINKEKATTFIWHLIRLLLSIFKKYFTVINPSMSFNRGI